MRKLVICKICGKEFYTDHTYCKTCSLRCRRINKKLLNAQHIQRKRANNQTFKEKEKEYKQTEKYKEYAREYSRKQRELGNDFASKNPEKKKEYDKQYFQANKEKARIRGRAYHKLHPEYSKKSKANRRSIEKDIDPMPDARIVKKRIDLFNGCCFCKGEGALTLDHLIPLSSGGTHEENNLLGACRKCNCSKQDINWQDWFRKQSFYDVVREKSIILACNQ